MLKDNTTQYRQYKTVSFRQERWHSVHIYTLKYIHHIRAPVEWVLLPFSSIILPASMPTNLLQYLHTLTHLCLYTICQPSSPLKASMGVNFADCEIIPCCSVLNTSTTGKFWNHQISTPLFRTDETPALNSFWYVLNPKSVTMVLDIVCPTYPGLITRKVKGKIRNNTCH